MKTCSFPSCESYIEGNTSMCARHNHEMRKDDRDAKKRKLITKTTTKELKDSHLWIPFSKFIRLRDADENGICTCFTCGDRQEWNSGGMQAGHFIGRRHWATRYDEMNVHAQCSTCNQFNGGMQFEYGIKLDQVYGEGTAMRLREMSNQLAKFTEEELYALAGQYRRKVKELLMKIRPTLQRPTI